jgi:hypothetical protein
MEFFASASTSQLTAEQRQQLALQDKKKLRKGSPPAVVCNGLLSSQAQELL